MDILKRLSDVKAWSLSGIVMMLLFASILGGWKIWSNKQLEAEQLTFLERYFDFYLSNYYKDNHSWEGAEERIEQQLKPQVLLLEGQLLLTLWNDQGKRVAATIPVNNEGLDRIGHPSTRAILENGEIVGYFQLSYRSNKPFSYSLWGSLLIIAAVGIGCWTLLAKRLFRASQAPLLYVRTRLRAVVEHGQDNQLQPHLGDANSKLPANEMLPAWLDEPLTQLEQRLDKLERVRRTMVADIAHELRTPLAVIRLKLENALARQEPISPEEVVILHDEAYRVTKLIHDLNQLVLAESGTLSLERSWFSLTELLQQLVETMLPDIEDAGTSIDLSGFDSPCLLFADRIRIQQVFVNLLGNAVRYANSHIQIRCVQQEMQVQIRIRDDGQGIDEEDLPHIFERFYREKQGTTNDESSSSQASERESNSKPHGMGLGLAIVKEYVLAHGGEVTASSKWNEGTEFTVTLPSFRN